MGVNCCDAEAVGPALETVRAQTSKPVVVYPNSGERWDAVARRWRGAHAPISELACGWVEAGARAVGGCCRVGPSEIAAVAAALR